MDPSVVSPLPAEKPKQPLVNRLIFFVIGGGLSSLLNTSILWFAEKALHWPKSYALALSVVITAVVFFIWSYYINFRTSKDWKNCLPRYLGCLVITNILNYVITLSGIKKFGTGSFLMSWLIVTAVYSVTGCVKFVLYNYWVFPRGGDGAPPSAS